MQSPDSGRRGPMSRTPPVGPARCSSTFARLQNTKASGSGLPAGWNRAAGPATSPPPSTTHRRGLQPRRLLPARHRPPNHLLDHRYRWRGAVDHLLHHRGTGRDCLVRPHPPPRALQRRRLRRLMGRMGPTPRHPGRLRERQRFKGPAGRDIPSHRNPGFRSLWGYVPVPESV
jgi:hypothetical protein